MPRPETQSVSQDSHAALCQIMVAKGCGPQINECNRISNQCVAHPKNCPRLKTNASIPGVERLSISSMRPDAGCKPPFSIPPTQVGDYDDGVLWPLHAFMVKGWSRSLAAVTVMLCAYEEPSFLQAWIIFGFDVLSGGFDANMLHLLFTDWCFTFTCRLGRKSCNSSFVGIHISSSRPNLISIDV